MEKWCERPRLKGNALNRKQRRGVSVRDSWRRNRRSLDGTFCSPRGRHRRESSPRRMSHSRQDKKACREMHSKPEGCSLPKRKRSRSPSSSDDQQHPRSPNEADPRRRHHRRHLCSPVWAPTSSRAFRFSPICSHRFDSQALASPVGAGIGVVPRGSPGHNVKHTSSRSRHTSLHYGVT